MEKEIYLVLYIAFGGGSVILFIFSLLAFLDVKGLHIEEGKNIRGGIILLITSENFCLIETSLKSKLPK